MTRLIVSSLVLAVTLLAANPAIDGAKAKIKEGKYEEAVAALETARKAAPKDTALTKALAEAHMAQADFFMFNEKMPPFRKYPAALRSYRKVLELDPGHAKAKENVGTIESIYKSMGRPVPQ
ncbi:MAG: tetratricopeptide repeat protein [Acidobacteria bacterium]|nr:tetratricopeptide repeat protein [Acidobacteriota bacterium]